MKITIQTPSRLHFGLLDLNGNLGRINGSFGVALDQPCWLIEYNSKFEVKEQVTLRNNTQETIKKFDNYFNVSTSNVKIKISNSIPKHIGLGSNTQFLLALGTILAKLHNLNVKVEEIAEAVQRGGTSGIGVASFDKGGIILDGGHTFGPGKQTETFQPSRVSKAPPPPVIFRNYPPDDWRFVLITRIEEEGASGKKEVNLFRENCPIPVDEVEKLSRLILVKILPAIVERDIRAFGEGLTAMQTTIPKFGMECFKSTLNQEIIDHLQRNKKSFGYGVSSFGPTIFSLTDSEESANYILKTISENFNKRKFKLLTSSRINTTGAIITIE